MAPHRSALSWPLMSLLLIVVGSIGLTSPPAAWGADPAATVSAGATPELLQGHPHRAQILRLFPAADRLGPPEGEPPSAAVLQGDDLLGFVLYTDDVAPIAAYSGKPVNHLVGLDLEGNITGAFVIEHHEPILLAGIPERRLHEFVAQYAGNRILDPMRVGAMSRPGYVMLDGVTGATVTVLVQNETILRSGRAVAIARGIVDPDPAAALPPSTVRMEIFAAADWESLLGEGSIGNLLVTRGEADDAFAGTPAEGVATAPPDERDQTFIDLYYAHLNPPTIGRNLLGERQYDWLMEELDDGEHAVLIMANGRYSFRGHGFVRGGIFDRFQLVQDDRGITFRDLDHHRPTALVADGMPSFGETAIFIIRAEHELDPGRPWQAELLVVRQVGALLSEYVVFAGDYRLPDAYVDRPDPPAAAQDLSDQPIWVIIWHERSFHIAVLGGSLLLLTLILFFQDWLVRRPRLLSWLRTGFLVYTLVFIGWYTLAQLSVVNVLTFTNAVIGDFRWETFLMDPMMFILWSFVAVTLLLWGRGVYCGWLCPFGALQELVNKVANFFKVPQFNFPPIVHDRLWSVKYIILLVLFGVSLQSMAQAEWLAEVEPFKTAIVLHFQREWAYVFYAGALVAISAFNHKFYCKYLCALGAALAIGGRLRQFEWLRRRKECGRPCQICANECEVQAIKPTGEINMNECHYCMDCQVTYYNDRKCPPVVEKRKRRERVPVAEQAVKRIEAGMAGKRGREKPSAEETTSG
ncbi:Nitrous oxide reductase maturation protein NosR [Thioalkalivibrio nitratireducens DSM 14787]|uniref:Nitrous oxide reductase maturation protein NosR n=1 Tax=Thioalkalivibrio nitratireducens (strain DSM 14787 / UNIQEM 213 / ALEN2) TaxID=1255043 RepID=L0DWE7_THIND|nr:NosR/NirI family protein [Thioalkalivibrio nitratireducens]AGA33300.1 Nitrous oxide reductase maturation protein NosR [Thioalkalivibrio nitratireducens DSM 14787]